MISELYVYLQIAVSTGPADAVNDADASNIVKFGYVLLSILVYT